MGEGHPFFLLTNHKSQVTSHVSIFSLPLATRDSRLPSRGSPAPPLGPFCLLARSLPRHQPIRAHGVASARRICQRSDLVYCADTRRLFVGGYGARLVSV